MSTQRNMSYDHPQYTTHYSASGQAGGAATTSYAKFIAFTAHAFYSTTLSVAIIGTAGTSTWMIQKVGTSGTTTYQLFTLATGAVGTGTQYLMSTGLGGVNVDKNEYLQVLSGGDATAILAVGYELGVQPLGNINT